MALSSLTPNISKLIIPSIGSLFKSYDHFVFDCDGVLWSYPTPMPHAKKLLHSLQEQNKSIFIITNASQKSRVSIQTLIRDFFDVEISLDRIFTSNYLAARYLSHNYPQVKRAYVVGHEIIRTELNNVGVSTNQFEHDAEEFFLKEFESQEYLNSLAAELRSDQEKNGKYDAVVTGIDSGFN